LQFGDDLKKTTELHSLFFCVVVYNKPFSFVLQNESDVAIQRFPSSRQQSKSNIEADHSPPSWRTDYNKPTSTAGAKPNWSPSSRRAEITNQIAHVGGDKATVTEVNSSPLDRRTVVPNHPVVESNWSPPVKRAELPSRISQPAPTGVDHPKLSTPPTTTNSFQKFLMKKTAQVPAGGVAPDHARSSQDSADASKHTKNSLTTDIGSSSPKNLGLPKELPPSILNRIAKNVRGKPARQQQYGNIASSGDLIANLAMKYGKQPMGGAGHVQDPMPVKQQSMKPVAPPVNDHVINEECRLFHWLNCLLFTILAADLADVLRQFSLDKFISTFEEHEVRAPPNFAYVTLIIFIRLICRHFSP